MFKCSFLVIIFISTFSHADFKSEQVKELDKYCLESLKSFPGDFDAEVLKRACYHASYLSDCYSAKENNLIFHYDKQGTSVVGKRILVFSMFHGDELPAGSVARHWIERLQGMKEGRSTWRIVPIVNPDGVKNKTRVNGRGVDLNRNLPTKNWETLAHKHWTENENKNERRFPGKESASETETNCVMKQINNFKPDFIISIHTPYGVLDFDGPNHKPVIPRFHNLAWKRLGHYPGSLGRYMWAERNIPVLTIELKGNDFNMDPDYLSQLQDVVGTMAIRFAKK